MLGMGYTAIGIDCMYLWLQIMKVFTLILLFFGVFSVMHVFKNGFKKKQSSIITVYVHGTLFHFRNIFAKIPAAAKLTYVPDGLFLVKNLDKDVLPHELALEFCNGDSERFSFDDFYSFGWSGKLSFSERQKWGKLLAQQLCDLSIEYTKRDGVDPIIRIVTFSHGGNVALNTAQYLSPELRVELFLIACPVQPDTEPFVSAGCFSKIYTIYSLHDLIQVIDPINICRNIKRKIKKETRSEKLLSTRSLSYDLDKIKQACISVNGKHIGHLELFHLFNKHIPFVLQQLDSCLDVKGANILHIDVQDPHFSFLNPINIVKVLQGKEKNKKE